MAAISNDQVMDQLRTVQDPELHKDLVSLGMIKSVDIDGAMVRVHVELTTPACPLKEQIQADDWSADYRLFARDKWNADDLFVPVVRSALHMLPDKTPLVTALDDTGLRKTGRKIPGVGYRRDPMSPPFHVNLIPGQRFVQLSAMIPAGEAPSPARGVPVRFHHQPPVRKPKPSADEEAKKAYRERCRKNNLSTCGRDLIAQLRDEIDRRHDAESRKLVVAGDGSYTNKTVLRTVAGSNHVHRKNPCVSNQGDESDSLEKSGGRSSRTHRGSCSGGIPFA